MIHHIRGDATQPFSEGHTIGQDTLPFPLGQVQFVTVEPQLRVANMCAQHGYLSASNPTPIQYDALRACLRCIADEAGATGASIHMPRIGSGLAGGDWPTIETIVGEELADQATFVYTLPELNIQPPDLSL